MRLRRVGARELLEVKPTMALHFPSLSGRDISPTSHMFYQDVNLAVMPIGGRADKHKEFSIIFEGDKEAFGEAEGLIADMGRRDRSDLEGMVCDAVSEIAKNISWSGSAAHELIRDEDGCHRVLGFTTQNLLKLPGCFMQFIPRGDWGLWKKMYAVLPANRVWYLEMPVLLGGKKGYRRIIKKLGDFDQIGPRFWRADMESGRRLNDFNFVDYVKNYDIYIGQTTKLWGWNRRDWGQEKCTEFFTFYKMVDFYWAQAILREHIVDEINKLFKRLNVRCEIKVNGLPRSSDILQVKAELLKGNISFGTVMERVSV